MNRDDFSIRVGGCWPPRVVEVEQRGPAFLDGLKLLFVTDVHVGAARGAERLMDRLIALIMRLDADLILWGGDYAEWPWHGDLLARMRQLRPALGMFGVLGNNDQRAYRARRQLFDDAEREAGFQMLVNRSARVCASGGHIQIIGIDEPKLGRPDLGLLGAPRDREEYRILLSHSPLALHDMPDDPTRWPDLILCGHTHGGQLNLFGLNPYTVGYEGARERKHFQVTGQHKIHGSLLIVSNGIGTSLIPLRIGAPPEVHLVRFTSAGAHDSGPEWAKIT